MEKICGIYKITSPSKRIYIGQSIDIYYRLNLYKKYRCKNQLLLYNSLKKYGWEKHKFEIIHQCNPEELNKLEKYYVDLFNTFNTKYGLNIRDGGGSNGKMSEQSRFKMKISALGRKRSPESIEKTRIAHLGTKHSLETREKMSKGNKGKRLGYKATIETREKMSKAKKGKRYNLGRKHSIETREKMSKAKKGKRLEIKFTIEHREKISKAKKGIKLTPEHIENMKKAYLKLEMNMKIILNTENGIYYKGVKNAANSLGINKSTLTSKLNGHIKNNTPFIYV